MSTCISPKGEYSDHVFEGETFGSEFICGRCFVFDEDAAQAEIVRLRTELAQRDSLLAAIKLPASTCTCEVHGSYAPGEFTEYGREVDEDCPEHGPQRTRAEQIVPL